jgi:hypothetical protein
MVELQFTYAKSDDLEGLYGGGRLLSSGSSIDIEDLLIFAKGHPFKLKRVYLDEEWVRKVIGYILPTDEKDLVLADD